MKRISYFVLGGLSLTMLLGATVYNQFSPGGALSGTWNSQNVNVGAGAPFITGLLPVTSGGTGLGTLTAHGVLLGEGTSNVAAVSAMAADTLLQGQGTSANPAAVNVNNCGSTTQALSYSTTTHAFGCQTITGAATPAGVTGNVQYNNAGAFGGVGNGTSGQALLSNGSSAPAWGVPALLTVTQSVANANIPPVLANGTTMNYAAGVTINPSTATVTATTFSGNATNATLAALLTTASTTTNANYAVVLANGTTMQWDTALLDNPSTHTLSATTFSGALNGNATSATSATTAANLSGGAVTTSNGALLSGGTKFTASGCTNSATVGGAIAGQFTSGTTGTCTVTITLPTAPNGWACRANDITTPAVMNQTAKATTSCTISGSTTSGDIVVFLAMGY